MRRRHGGRRARVRGQVKVAADFDLLAAAVNLARLAVLGGPAKTAPGQPPLAERPRTATRRASPAPVTTPQQSARACTGPRHSARGQRSAAPPVTYDAAQHARPAQNTAD